MDTTTTGKLPILNKKEAPQGAFSNDNLKMLTESMDRQTKKFIQGLKDFNQNTSLEKSITDLTREVVKNREAAPTKRSQQPLKRNTKELLTQTVAERDARKTDAAQNLTALHRISQALDALLAGNTKKDLSKKPAPKEVVVKGLTSISTTLTKMHSTSTKMLVALNKIERGQRDGKTTRKKKPKPVEEGYNPRNLPAIIKSSDLAVREESTLGGFSRTEKTEYPNLGKMPRAGAYRDKGVYLEDKTGTGLDTNHRMEFWLKSMNDAWLESLNVLHPHEQLGSSYEAPLLLEDHSPQPVAPTKAKKARTKKASVDTQLARILKTLIRIEKNTRGTSPKSKAPKEKPLSKETPLPTEKAEAYEGFPSTMTAWERAQASFWKSEEKEGVIYQEEYTKKNAWEQIIDTDRRAANDAKLLEDETRRSGKPGKPWDFEGSDSEDSPETLADMLTDGVIRQDPKIFARLGLIGSGFAMVTNAILGNSKGTKGGTESSSSGGSGLFGNVFKGGIAKMFPKLAKTALIGGLIWAGVDAVTGYMSSSDWGVSKLSGLVGGLLGGTIDGDSGALKGAGKGALLGSKFGPMGVIVGSLLGAALGYVGGARLARITDEVVEAWNESDIKAMIMKGLVNIKEVLVAGAESWAATLKINSILDSDESLKVRLQRAGGNLAAALVNGIIDLALKFKELFLDSLINKFSLDTLTETNYEDLTTGQKTVLNILHPILAAKSREESEERFNEEHTVVGETKRSRRDIAKDIPYEDYLQNTEVNKNVLNDDDLQAKYDDWLLNGARLGSVKTKLTPDEQLVHDAWDKEHGITKEPGAFSKQFNDDLLEGYLRRTGQEAPTHEELIQPSTSDKPVPTVSSNISNDDDLSGDITPEVFAQLIAAGDLSNEEIVATTKGFASKKEVSPVNAGAEDKVISKHKDIAQKAQDKIVNAPRKDEVAVNKLTNSGNVTNTYFNPSSSNELSLTGIMATANSFGSYNIQGVN